MTTPFSPPRMLLASDFLGTEPIQPSSLGAYGWPQCDPREVDQSTRLATPRDYSCLYQAAEAAHVDPDQYDRRSRNLSLPDQIFDFLTRKPWNFNRGVLAEQLWATRIAEAVTTGQPIRCVYPLFCKNGCCAKQFDNAGPLAGEAACLLHFANLNSQLRRIYPPGLVIEAVCDARLYNAALQVNPAEVERYVARLESLIMLLRVGDTVHLTCYAELLNRFAAGRFDERLQTYRQLLRHAPDSLLSGLNVLGLQQSLRSSINTRDLELSYDEARSLFGPNTNEPAPRVAKEVEERTEHAFTEMMAIRIACAEIDVFHQIWPDHIRVSCHRGPKAGRRVIGLRCYPEYYASSRFLPYHGAPLLRPDRKGGWKLEIHPEVILRGRLDLTRVEGCFGGVLYIREPVI